MKKILAIDDKEDNLITLSALLKNLMPECVMIRAKSGREGIEKAKEESPDTILLDVKMPDMDGFETCRTLMSDEKTKHIPVIMITAIKTDLQSRIKGLEMGANTFLAKPIDEYELVSQLKVALRIKEAEDALREERNSLECIVRERTADLLRAKERLIKSLVGTVQAMSMMVETRDPYTAGHQKRVSNLAGAVAKELGLPEVTIENIQMAGSIHDIGKMSVPAEILSKPTILTDLEFRLIMVHPESGFEILKDIDLPGPIAEIVLQHHERLNGSGYPKGLKGNEILFETKIVSVADVVEAMASHRPYRPSKGIDAALEEIEKNKGILYDEKVVDVCIKLFMEKRFSFDL